MEQQKNREIKVGQIWSHLDDGVQPRGYRVVEVQEREHWTQARLTSVKGGDYYWNIGYSKILGFTSPYWTLVEDR